MVSLWCCGLVIVLVVRSLYMVGFGYLILVVLLSSVKLLFVMVVSYFDDFR